MKNGLFMLVPPLGLLMALLWMGRNEDNPAPVDKSEAASVVPQNATVENAPPVVADDVKAQYEPLAFADMFIAPVGPRGLEYTDRLKALEGKKVRMTGHMVRYLHADPAVFLFTEFPATHNQQEYMLADSLPVNTMHVLLKVRSGDAPVWKPLSLTLYGTLETGGRQEADGRISFVRLRCEHVTEAPTGRLINLMRPVALQRERIAQGAALQDFRPTTNSQDIQTQ